MTSRLSLLKEDFELTKRQCGSTETCQFQGFELGEHFCHFVFKDGIVQKEYKIHFSDEYPAMSLLTVTDRSRGQTAKADSRQCNDRLPILLTKLAKEMQVNVIIKLPGETNSPRDVEMSDDCGSDNSSDDDYDPYYASGDETGVHVYEWNQLLEQDLENLRHLFGDDSVNTVVFDTIDGIDVEFLVPLDFLDPEIANAWRLSNEPLICRINFSLSRYLDATKPSVKVYQASQTKFGIGSQLEKILEEFLSLQWKGLSNEMVRRESKLAKRKVTPHKEPHHRKRHPSSSGDDTVHPVQPLEVSDKAMAEVINMGFDASLARNALIITHNDVQEAIEILVTDNGRCLNGAVSHAPPTAGGVNCTPGSPTPKQLKTSGKHHSKHAKAVKHKDPKSSSAKGLGKNNLLEYMGSFLSGLLPDSPSTAVIDPISVPGIQHGFLVQMMQYIRQRLPTLNEYCVICDKRHVFQNGAMLKPAVCGGQLCVFSFQTLGVMSDAADDIATGAAVVDLLIAMANAACRSPRRDTIFDPYPTVIDPHEPTELAFNPNDKDYPKVEKILDVFLNTHEMVQFDAANLKKNMDVRNSLAYPLLQWIINSNRSHIVKLPEEKRVSFMKTPHQFLLMSSAPAKEAAFRQAREKYGSIFAFHGSTLENWHSIMRVGLINASGTKYQLHGAAYGKGIYLSPKVHVSFGYCGAGGRHFTQQRQGSKKESKEKGTGSSSSQCFLYAKNLTCIALCEVVNSAELTKSSDIWVMKNDEHVCTRFFFVYESGVELDTGIDATKESCKKEIAKAMSYSYR